MRPLGPTSTGPTLLSEVRTVIGLAAVAVPRAPGLLGAEPHAAPSATAAEQAEREGAVFRSARNCFTSGTPAV